MDTLLTKKCNMYENLGVRRAASKTDRNFTGDNAYDALPTAVFVGLDWLEFMAYCVISEPAENQIAVALNDDWIIEYLQMGTRVFKYSYRVYYGGEHVANIHTHSKNLKILKEGIIKVEICNHVLYSSSRKQVQDDLLNVLNASLINYSRMDICIDGANHVHAFLNNYIRQKPRNDFDRVPLVGTVGRWDQSCRIRQKGKANLDPKRFNKKTGMCDNFKVGSKRKNITVYNKFQELEKSAKEYIRDAWKMAGLDTETTNWRVELRMTSQAIHEIDNLDINRLDDPNYLLQIFKTQCRNFFEFVKIEKDTNVSRARVIDLFQFEKLRIPLLAKIPRAVVRGAYKAKMAVHNAFKDLCTGMIKNIYSMEAAVQHIADNIELYNLHRWYERKKYEWREIYAPLTVGIG